MPSLAPTARMGRSFASCAISQSVGTLLLAVTSFTTISPLCPLVSCLPIRPHARFRYDDVQRCIVWLRKDRLEQRKLKADTHRERPRHERRERRVIVARAITEAKPFPVESHERDDERGRHDRGTFRRLENIPGP